MPFTIGDFHDLVRLLEQHEDWRAALRRQMLGPELLTLPDLVRQLAEAQARTERCLEGLAVRVEELAAAQLRTEGALLILADRMDGLAGGLRSAPQEVGSLSEIVGAVAEEQGERALVATLTAKGYRLTAVPGPLTIDGHGEIDVAAPVEDADGQRFWVLLEARARLHRADVTGWDRRLRDLAFRAHLEAEGVTAPILVYAFGIRVYRDAADQGRASGIGILGPQGELVAPTPWNA